MVSQPSAIILPSNLSMEYPEHCSMENNPSSNAESHSTGQNIFQPFMEPKHSLLCLQEPTTGFCTQSFEFSRHPLSRIPFIVHFNNILPSTLRSPKWSLPSGFWLIFCMSISFPLCIIPLSLIWSPCSVQQYKLQGSSLYNYHPPPVTSFLDSNILLSTSLSIAFNLCSSLEILTVVVMKSTILWDITPYSPPKVNRSFGRLHRLHLQGRISQARYQRERR